ncbi:hypothetical protein ACIQCR_14840 [Streptomyces sp. NPDC093249]|uniref:hypothetical protein n=1 Tax=unclassified Streptomyces TaxID=2593676 RepID=UPI00344B94D1
MRRGLVHALAWSLATGAAGTLSWWGVHTVLSGTVYDPPRALPLPAGPVEEPPASGDPLSSSTQRPDTAPPSTPAPSRRTPDGGATTAPAAPATTPARTTAPMAPPPAAAITGTDSGSNVKSYTVDGGRVAFDLGKTSAELVSATPASGWQMQVWKDATWIRVTFTSGGRELSVFCLWHDSAPRVQIEERAV